MGGDLLNGLHVSAPVTRVWEGTNIDGPREHSDEEKRPLERVELAQQLERVLGRLRSARVSIHALMGRLGKNLGNKRSGRTCADLGGSAGRLATMPARKDGMAKRRLEERVKNSGERPRDRRTVRLPKNER